MKHEYSVETKRALLWSLLGDLPWTYRCGMVQTVRVEQRDGYTLEHLVLDLNGVEPVPALLLVPKQRLEKAPAMLYCHAHFGTYPIGKEELLDGRKVMGSYAPVLAEKGIVTLAIDSWCFGERNRGGPSGAENSTFKHMLWNGQVLFGMMLFDLVRALDYLSARTEVDPNRLGVMGLSMGATQAWWLAALDTRIKLCVDLCCLTDFHALIEAHNLHRHGFYYYVPRLLQHFDSAAINELIAPRARLSLNGRRDDLTPPVGVEAIRQRVYAAYQKLDSQRNCLIELFDSGHEETPEMRALVSKWLDEAL